MDARRLRLIGVVLALVVAGCGNSTSSSGTTTSSSTSSSVAPTTSSIAATTTTSAAPTTTTTVAVKSDFEPACTATSGGAAASAAAFDTFGPLGPVPAVAIKLPTLPPEEGSPDRLTPAAHVARTASGLVVAVTNDPESGTPSTSSILAGVGFDGTKRWVRCLDSQIFGVWAAPSNPSTALVVLSHETSLEYHIVSAVDGQDTTPADLAALTSFSVMAESSTGLLLAHSPAEGSLPDSLRLYDLSTSKLESVPLPPGFASGAEGFITFGFDDQGEPTVGSPSIGPITAVYRDGEWATDAAALDAAVGSYADFTTDNQILTGHDGSGSVRWTDPQFTRPGYETSAIEADGPMTVAALCTHPATICTSYELDGVVTSTGKVAWKLPGFRQMGAIGDGYALVNDSEAVDPDPNSTATPTPGWILVDTRTGKQVADDQHWTDTTFFQQGCCSDYSTWVERFGGVVVAQNADVLRVWLPRDASPAHEHDVSLP